MEAEEGREEKGVAVAAEAKSAEGEEADRAFVEETEVDGLLV